MTKTTTKLPEKKSTSLAPAEDWRPFESFRREVDRLFDDFSMLNWRFPSRVFGRYTPDFPQAAWQIAPAVDIVEKEDQYEITAELPGLDEKDVEIKVTNQSLTIKGEKGEQREEKQKDYHLTERSYGSFQRSFNLPDGVDADRIAASFAKGVLTVTLPKNAESKQAERKIKIKTG